MSPEVWPPTFVERRTQRQKVLERIQDVGGWEAVRRGCEALTTNSPDGFTWFPLRSVVDVYRYPQTGSQMHYATNADDGPLPPAIAALQPKEIRCYPARDLRNSQDAAPIAVVSIKIFGIHRTGGRPIPYYGLEVPCGPGAEDCQPRPSSQGASGNRHSSFRKLSERVFEVY